MSQLKPSCNIEKLYEDIENGTLKLPQMPNWALKILRMLDDINISTDLIITAVASDPTFVAKLFKSANSAAYTGKPKVDNVRSAITRLGFKGLRNLVVAASMNSLSGTSNNLTVNKSIANFWVHSREVATISYLVAKSQKHLNEDQAMLAGLVHDIGALPLFIAAAKMFPNIDEYELSAIVRRCSAISSEKMLREWGFPPELIEIPIAHENLQIQTDTNLASYADVVTVANLLNRATAKIINWENISAVQRLGLGVQVYQEFFERFENDIVNVGSMLEV